MRGVQDGEQGMKDAIADNVEAITFPISGPVDSRSRIERLLNYKRYIDWLIEKELENVDDKRGTSRASKVRRNA